MSTYKKVPEYPFGLDYGSSESRSRIAKPSVAQLNADLKSKATKETVPQKRTASDVLDNELRKIQKQHDDFDAKVQALKTTNDADFNAKKQALKEASDLFQREILALSEKNTEAEREKNQLRSELGMKKKLTKSLDELLLRVTEELNSRKAECERKDVQMKEMVAKMDNLEAVHYQLKQDLAAKKKEVHKLKLDYDDSQKVQRDLSVSLTSMHGQVAQKYDEIADLRAFVGNVLKVAAGAPKFVAEPVEKSIAEPAEKSTPALPPARTVALPSTRASHSAPIRK
ncbi:hypothetical protein P171DRAFT_430036 [Karstenula rhodostoma CBS 690.94]|uniref:Uncharacterized protein n=1 Tax=Karstenula rhodostoma CBS 690.94 TaxID=1392251 RepID=A0A9P4UF40_9PLEO|nr:hypothetical protein P171DRAFT_430036 [Karstenula rhodostoma CBS 690.94]